MQPPIPRTPHIGRLRIQGIVPAPSHDFGPTFGVERQLDMPDPPCELAFWGEVFEGNFIPEEAPVGTDFDSFGPATATTVGPAFDRDGAAVDDDLLLPGFHDGTADGHLLDLYTFRVQLVMFPNLNIEVEIFLRLDRSVRGMSKCFYAVEPFHGAGPDIAKYYCAERKAVDLGERLAVHLPGKHNFVEFYF